MSQFYGTFSPYTSNSATSYKLPVTPPTRSGESRKSDLERFSVSQPSEGPLLGILTKTQSALVSQGIKRHILRDTASDLLPKERVTKCGKNRISKDKPRSVMYSQQHQTCHYSNVQNCGSVWICPCCSGRISQKRRDELTQASKRWIDFHGGQTLLLSLTNRHHAEMPLRWHRAGQRKAMKYFWGDRRGKVIFELLRRVHHVTAHEITHGRNGWHPHHHVLLFVDNPTEDLSFIEHELKLHWINCCKKAGLPLPTLQVGLDLRDGTQAAGYISKWGMAEEMTLGHLKKAKGKGVTPFQLLEIASGVGGGEGAPTTTEQRAESRKLFQEYGVVYKGTRQLSWSRGSKAALLIDDKTDQQLADETNKESIELHKVTDTVFTLLCRYRLTGQYLYACAFDHNHDTELVFGIVSHVVNLEINRLRKLE